MAKTDHKYSLKKYELECRVTMITMKQAMSFLWKKSSQLMDVTPHMEYNTPHCKQNL